MKSLCSCCLLMFLTTSALAVKQSALDSLELDSLMHMDVQATSAMKRSQSTFTTAASLYVLSKEDILASGATNVAESLKLVPGLEIRQLDNNQWAISSRSVAGRYSSKLLVMVDGQSVYNPSFAGVYWETLNIPLYDIERIEVIRGQGGLLWGSNATNGVINIITQNSLDTRGPRLQIAAGSTLNYNLAFRYGEDIGSKGSYRFYGDLRNSDAAEKNPRGPANDDSRQQSVGARFDFAVNDNLSILTQLSYTHTENGQLLKIAPPTTHKNTLFPDQFERHDGRIMARIDHRLSNKSNQMLQASWAIQDGNQLFLEERFHYLDIDYQMNTLVGKSQIDWGVNYRNNRFPIEDNIYISSDKDLDKLQQGGVFLQAQFPLISDKLNFILGNKSEYNSFTDWEHQPVARLLWQPKTKHVIWGAVSQGVRIPSLAEFDYDVTLHGQPVGNYIQTNNPTIDNYHIRTVLNGNNQIEPEKSTSYELGYRLAEKTWNIDIALFHTRAKNAIAVHPNLSTLPLGELQQYLIAGQHQAALELLSATTIEFDLESNAALHTTGGEALLSWAPNSTYSAELGYHYVDYRYELQPNTTPAIGYDSTMQQWFTKLRGNISSKHALFALYRYADNNAYQVDNHHALDLTWSWFLTPRSTLQLAGKNLLHKDTIEYKNTSETFTFPSFIEPSVTLSIAADF